jgi:hypothetical protein
MSSEAVLEYPPIFTENAVSSEKIGDKEVLIRAGPSRLELAKEYMLLAKQYPPNQAGQGSGVKCIKMHLHRFLHAELQLSTALRDQACFAKTQADLDAFIENVEIFQEERKHQIKHERLEWYWRYRIIDENGVNLYELKVQSEHVDPVVECDEDECLNSLFVDDNNGY